MPTLGYTDVGDSDTGLNAGIASKFTASENGNIVSMSVRIGSFTSQDFVRTAIYADSGGVPGALLAQSTEVEITGANTWFDTTISLAITASTTYWLAAFSSASATCLGRFLTGVGDLSTQSGATYPTWTDPWNQAGLFAHTLSIYATYTTGGALMGQILT